MPATAPPTTTTRWSYDVITVVVLSQPPPAMPQTERILSLCAKYGGRMPKSRAKRRYKKVGKSKGPATMKPKAKRAHRRKTKVAPKKWFGKTAHGRGLSPNAKAAVSGLTGAVVGAVLQGALGSKAASKGTKHQHWNREYSRRHPQHLKNALPHGFWDTFGNGLERTGGRVMKVVGAPRAVVAL